MRQTLKRLYMVWFAVFAMSGAVNAQLLGYLIAEKLSQKGKSKEKVHCVFTKDKVFQAVSNGQVLQLKGKPYRYANVKFEQLDNREPDYLFAILGKYDVDTFFVDCSVGEFLGYLPYDTIVRKIPIVSNGIRYYANPPEDFKGVQGFSTKNINNYSDYKREDTYNVYLPDAVILDSERDVKNHYGYFTKSNMGRVVFSPCIRKIGKGAFRDCKNLQEVIFLDGCDNVEVDAEAFVGCDALHTIRVPKGTTQDYIAMGLPARLLIDGEPDMEYNIILEKPGTILSQLPLENLNKVVSLTITGFLDDNDMSIIRDMINLKHLDISHTYTTYSLQTRKKQKEAETEAQFLLGLFQGMGALAEAQYQNGEINTMDNLQVQLFAEGARKASEELAKDASQVNRGIEDCIIPPKAFFGMENLETVKLPYRATKIYNNAFASCRKLKSVELPPYLTLLDYGAFYCCSSLKSIELPQHLTTINNGAFEGCWELEDVLIPASLNSMVFTAFDNCSKLQKLDLSHCVFNSDKSDICIEGCKNLKELRLPEGLKIIEGRLMRGNNSVHIYLPKSLETMMGVDFYIENLNLHFQSGEPPTLRKKALGHAFDVRNCKIFAPKSCITKYYPIFNKNGNVIKEE